MQKETSLKDILMAKVKNLSLNFGHKFLVVPVRAKKGTEFNYSLVRAKPRTPVLEGVTYEQACELRETLEKHLHEELMRKLKEHKDGKSTNKNNES